MRLSMRLAGGLEKGLPAWFGPQSVAIAWCQTRLLISLLSFRLSILGPEISPFRCFGSSARIPFTFQSRECVRRFSVGALGAPLAGQSKPRSVIIYNIGTSVNGYEPLNWWQ